MPYIPDFNGADVYPSPEREPETPDTQSSTPATKAPAKRKRENRYKNAPPSVLSVRLFSLTPLPVARRKSTHAKKKMNKIG